MNYSKVTEVTDGSIREPAGQFICEPQGTQWIPLFFSAQETQERRIETTLDGGFIFDPPRPGFLPTVRANPMTIPLDLYGTKDVPYETQLQYPPANLGKDFGQLQPLVFPDKYLHQIMEWR